MDAPPPSNPAAAGRSIVIFSDGTGQRGGVYFDESRTNIYKLYRAARCGPDSLIPPERQLAFYDPGLGTRSTGSVLTSFVRTIYNYVSQATGLGITHNIIDCYTAIIQLWRPGDRIFLFGFSRGAYTVRCLATALCLSGIPTQEGEDKPPQAGRPLGPQACHTRGQKRLPACSSPDDVIDHHGSRAAASNSRSPPRRRFRAHHSVSARPNLGRCHT